MKVSTKGWRPGSYLIRLEVAGHASYVPLIVRSPSTKGRLVLMAPSTTWQAYNDWGGRNLYWGLAGKGTFADRPGRCRTTAPTPTVTAGASSSTGCCRW